MTQVDPKDEITIYLAGYAALRTQMLQRSTAGIQIFAFAGTVLLALAGFVLTQSIAVGVGLGLLLALFAVFTLRLNKADTKATAKRLEELRLHINRLANEELLHSEAAGGAGMVHSLPALQNAAQSLGGLLFRRRWHRQAGA